MNCIFCKIPFPDEDENFIQRCQCKNSSIVNYSYSKLYTYKLLYNDVKYTLIINNLGVLLVFKMNDKYIPGIVTQVKQINNVDDLKSVIKTINNIIIFS